MARLNGRRLKRAGSAFAALGIASLLSPAVAPPARAWEPMRFEAFCGQPYGTELDLKFSLNSVLGSGLEDQPDNRFYYAKRYGDDVDIAQEPGCLSDVRQALVADYAAEALAFYKSLGFASPAPNRLGPIVRGRDGQPGVRLFIDRTNKGVAYTVSPCSPKTGKPDSEQLSVMRFAPRYLNDFPPPRALHIIAHELVHVVQNAQAYVNDPDTDDCGRIPGWLHEGTADALGMHVTHRHFPDYRPGLAVKGALSFYGLRPYDRAFTWDDETARDGQGNSILPNYRSSSFWEHLADHYYGGDFSYLSGFLAVPDLTFNGDDWLNWLDESCCAAKAPGAASHSISSSPISWPITRCGGATNTPISGKSYGSTGLSAAVKALISPRRRPRAPQW